MHATYPRQYLSEQVQKNIGGTANTVSPAYDMERVKNDWQKQWYFHTTSGFIQVVTVRNGNIDLRWQQNIHTLLQKAIHMLLCQHGICYGFSKSTIKALFDTDN